MSCNMNEGELVTDKEEENKPTSDSRDKIPVNVINNRRESFRPNKNSKLSEFAYHKKDANTDTSAYDRVLKKNEN